MPRRGGSPAPRRMPSRSPPPRAAARPAPRPASPPPPPQQQRSGGLFGGGGGLGSTLATGMAFGAGSEVAHQAVRGIMGGGSGHGHDSAPAQSQESAPPAQYQEQAGAPPAAQPQYNPCMEYNQGLLSCMKQNNDSIGSCQNYMDMLKKCEMDNAHLFKSAPQF